MAAGPAPAQAPPGSLQAGLEWGRQYGGSLAKGTSPFFDHREQLDDNILHGFWFGTQLSRDWALELSVRRCPTQLIEPGPGIFGYQPAVAGLDYGVIEGAAVRVYRIGRFHPYWQVGGGLGKLDLSVADAPGPAWRLRNRPAVEGAAGARFWMASWFAFRFDLRANGIYLGTRGMGQDQGIADPGRWLLTQEVTTGIQLSFGGR